MNELLKTFAATYGPAIANLVIGGILAATDAIILATTNGKPDWSIAFIVNVGGAAALSYIESKGRDLLLKQTQAAKAKSDARLNAVLFPEPGNDNF